MASLAALSEAVSANWLAFDAAICQDGIPPAPLPVANLPRGLGLSGFCSEGVEATLSSTLGADA